MNVNEQELKGHSEFCHCGYHFYLVLDAFHDALIIAVLILGFALTLGSGLP